MIASIHLPSYKISRLHILAFNVILDLAVINGEL
jgi:hypothetical protein